MHTAPLLHPDIQAMERLGDEIALLAAHITVATARLLDYGKGPQNTAEGEPPSTSQRQADALALIAEAALRHELDHGAPSDRDQVVVHVDDAVLADPAQPGQSVLEDGDNVSAETSRFPPALRRALQYRDRGCRFPGCGLPLHAGPPHSHGLMGVRCPRCRACPISPRTASTRYASRT